MKIPDPRFPVDRVHRSTILSLLIVCGFWAWLFGNAWTDPNHPEPPRYRVPKTTPVEGGKDA